MERLLNVCWQMFYSFRFSKARGGGRKNLPSESLSEGEREKSVSRRAPWRSEISCYLRVIGERRRVGGGDTNARSFGRIDRIQGAAVKRLAHETCDVQYGLPVALDHLIVAHRFAGGDAELAVGGHGHGVHAVGVVFAR